VGCAKRTMDLLPKSISAAEAGSHPCDIRRFAGGCSSGNTPGIMSCVEVLDCRNRVLFRCDGVGYLRGVVEIRVTHPEACWASNRELYRV
jgi:hypothetical protein